MIRYGLTLLGLLALLVSSACGGDSTPTSATPVTPQNLQPVLVVLSVGTAGSGTGTITSTDLKIQCGEICQTTVLLSTTVTLTAQPDPGFMFGGFEGDPDCADGVVSLFADVSCLARFDVPRVLRVSTTGVGAGSVTSPNSTISCGTTCEETFLLTTTVTLVGVPEPGSVFAGFAGDPDCADGSVMTSTDVTCTAEFQPASALSATSFLAFGDSFTFGIVSQASLRGFQLVGTPQSYPSLLEGLLTLGYPFQVMSMDNRGVPGELASEGVLRLPGVLASVSPSVEVFLLLHGVNDIEAVRRGASISAIAADIDSMVQQAQAAGLTVFLATLPPQDVAGRRDVALLVPVFNQEIARIAATRQATLVDVFSGMNLSMIGGDGLHPTAAGYQRMAELFFSAITSALDVPFSLTTTLTGSWENRTGSSTMRSGPQRRPLPPQLRLGRD